MILRDNVKSDLIIDRNNKIVYFYGKPSRLIITVNNNHHRAYLSHSLSLPLSTN